MFKNFKLKVISLIVVITVIFTNTFNVFALSVYISTGSWTNQNVYMEIDGSTDSGGSGLLKYQYKIGTGAWQDYNVGSLPTITTEGQTTVYAKAIDRANNESPEASAIVKIDKTNPTAGSLTSSVESYTKNTSYNVIINNVNDTFSGISRVSFPTWTNYNGQDDIVWPVGMKLNGYKYDYSQNVPWTYHGSDITVNTSTQYKLSMEIYISPDANIPASGSTLVAAGEMGYGAASYYDNTKKGQWQKFETTQIPTGTTARILMYPTTSASPATTGYVLFRNITFTQVGVENNNLFAQPDYNDGFSIRGNGNFLKYEENWSYTVKASEHNNEDGLYYTHMYAYDNANNSVYVGGTSVTIDRGIPTAPIINANTNWTNATNVSVSITPGTDNVSGVNKTEYSLSGATTLAYTNYSSSFNIFNEGQTTISARTTDNAGNIATASAIVKIDRTGPTAASVTNNVVGTVGQTFKVFANNVIDSASGVSTVKFLAWTNNNGMDDQRWYTATNISGNWEATIDRALHGNESGIYTMEAYGYDVAGNSRKLGTTTVTTNQPPAATIISPSTGSSFKVGDKPTFTVKVTDADNDVMSASLEYYTGSAWQTITTVNGLINNQTTSIIPTDIHWQNIAYDTSFQYRIKVSDASSESYSNVINIKKINTAPTLTINSPSANQYMISGYLQFNIDAADPDNQGYNNLSLKVYTDTANVGNAGVFYNSNISSGNTNFVSFSYMPVGQHNIKFELSDGKTTLTQTRVINIAEEISLYTGNEEPTFYITNFDVEKNDVYYKRLNNKLTDLIHIINILGANGDKNETYLSNIIGMQNVTGDIDYKDNGSRIYTKDGIQPEKIVDWIVNKVGLNSEFNQVLKIGDSINIKNIIFNDEEKDYTSTSPNRGKNRRVQFFHIPSYYENPDAEISDNGTWVNFDSFTTFDGQPVINDGNSITIQYLKAGKYILNIQEDDEIFNPSGVDFSKPSNLMDYTIYVHRQPKSVIRYTDNGNGTIKLDASQSYDLDFYSRPDKGIKSYVFQYRLLDYSDNIYQDWTNITDVNSFTANGIYRTEIRLKVTDYGALIGEENDGELSDTSTIVLDATGVPPIADFEFLVGISIEGAVPANGVVYRGPNGKETVLLDDSLIQWNDLLAPLGGSRSQNSDIDVAGLNSLVSINSSISRSLTVTNKYGLSNSIMKSADVKSVDMVNNTESTMDAKTTYNFNVALTSSDYITRWGDFTVKIDSVDLGISNIVLNNTISNIFAKDSYIPESAPNNSAYTISVYSKRTGQLLVTNSYILTINNNSAPTVIIYGTTPSLIYDGDNVTVQFQPDDLDGDNLNIHLSLLKDGSEIWTGDMSHTLNAFGGYDPISSPIAYDIGIGSYEIIVTVVDPSGANASDQLSFIVYELGIMGYVNHTTLWEENRQKYNAAAAAAGNTTRDYAVFFPGEQFILNADTTLIGSGSSVTADSVFVQIENTAFGSYLVTSGFNIWEGTLWDESMMYWDSRQLKLIFTVTYSNGTTKVYEAKVFIQDDSYWRQHRLF